MKNVAERQYGVFRILVVLREKNMTERRYGVCKILVVLRKGSSHLLEIPVTLRHPKVIFWWKDGVAFVGPWETTTTKSSRLTTC